MSSSVFRDILGQVDGTYFGKKHGISRVRTLQDWKKAVPIGGYADIQPYIAKILDGDVNVLTASEPYAVLKTSGSSGKPKLIPTTRHWRNAYRGQALYTQWGLYFEQIGFDNAVGTSVLDLSWERARPTTPAGELPCYSISQRPAAVGPADWLPPWYDESWFQGVDGEDHRSGLYRKLRLLAGSDVRIIVSLNPSKIVGLAEVLAERSDDLISDVRNGTLRGRRCHGGDRDAELAARLTARQARNGGALRLADLWPNLSLVVCWNSASAALYRPWLDEMTPGVGKLPFSATGTEGIVTMPVDGHPSAGPLAVDLGLYEFAPVEERGGHPELKPDAHTLDYREVEIGKVYRVVMTQANGLYRYDLGDVYQVVDRVGGVPRLDFVGRAGFVGSFTGEKLTEQDVHEAVRRCLGDVWSLRPMFTCVPVWATPPGYTVAIEWPPQLTITVESFAERVDAELQRLNIEYAEKRRSERLTPLAVRPVTSGTFRLIEERRRREGVAPAQLKHHWIQRDDRFLEYLGDRPAAG